ncbi:hypothetical protein S40293_07073 [Stachybotrys chartarum IBT 40293]|nr:hypothetical protein S40293_07073 [Stachybotrys chartarum IBT 40293]
MPESAIEGANTRPLVTTGPVAEDLGFNASSYPDALIPLQMDEPMTQAFLYPNFQSLIMSNYQPSHENDFLCGQLTGWPSEAMLQDSGTLLEQSPGIVDLGLSEQPSSSADGTLSITRNLRTSSSQSTRTRVPGWSAFRHDAFKKSFWVWVPTREPSFLDCQHLSVDESLVMQDREAKVTQQCALTLPRITKSSARDGILSLTLQFAGFQPSLESFPSLTTFNLLMQTFFVREHRRVDSVVHPATFDPNQCRHDLLAAIVGAGTTMFAVTSAQKLGFSLQEIVRRAVCAGVVEDNTMSVTLQAIQACFFWFEVGLWSGVKKKMEIAEGFAHAVPSDQGIQLRQKWHRWVEQESFRRLVLRVFVHELRGSIAFGRVPLLSVSEMTFALPASRDLWDAGSPEEWKARYLAKPVQQRDISIIDVMHQRSRLGASQDVIDCKFAAHAILYALWARAWLFLESRSLAVQPLSFTRTTSSLWIETQRQALYQDIQATVLDLAAHHALTPDGFLFTELIMLYLYSSPDDMGRFASQFEVDDYYNALPALEQWLYSEDGCRAIWHAGQILRAARSFPPAELRGVYAIAVYQACLTLWVFAVLSGNAEKDKDLTCEPMIALDKEETNESRLYLTSGRGSPCVHVGGQMTRLVDPQLISTVMDEVLRNNFASHGYLLPPLVENLYSLVHELTQA